MGKSELLDAGGRKSLWLRHPHPQPRTPNPEPRTPNPEPRTPNPYRRAASNNANTFSGGTWAWMLWTEAHT